MFSSFFNGFQWLMEMQDWLWSLRDPRVENWFLAHSTRPVWAVLVVYFGLVHYGPKLMKNRQPFRLRSILIVYNVFIVIFNAYIVKEIGLVTYRQGYSMICEPVRVSTDPGEMRVVIGMYLYYISKLVELLDTVFIILRKKHSQLSFLHVYHHSSMFVLFWVVCRWFPGGNPIYVALINSFVHVLMYSYYCLCLLGPSISQHLWWKRYLTLVQIGQFIVGLSVGINYFFAECKSAIWTQYFSCLYMISYLLLFGRFYMSAYIVSGTKKFIYNEKKGNNIRKSVSKRNVD